MNLLDFASPMNWWWSLLAIPIIGLYILKVRLRRVPASTLLFWDQLYDEKKPRSWWQQLRHWLSLLLQLALVALLVAALTDPLWTWQKDNQRRVVLIVDNSASMQADEGDNGTRLDIAKRSGMSFVRSLRDNDQMAIVTAGGPPKVVWGMTDHHRWLVDAIEGIAPSDAPSELPSATELARRLLSGVDRETEIILLTDGCSPLPADDAVEESKADVSGSTTKERTKNTEESGGEKQTLQIFGVGDSQDNLAITRYQVRRSLVDAVGYQVLVDVSNYSDTPQETRLELDLEGELIDVLPIKLEPGGTKTEIVNHTSAGGGIMRAMLDAQDGLELDNEAVAVLPRREQIPITLFSPGNLFVASVLSSIPLVELTIEEEFDPGKNYRGLLVFDQACPADLPPGRTIVIDPRGDTQLWKLGDPISEPIVADVDKESPLTQHVRLDNVLFPGARQLEISATYQGLIRDPLEQPLLSRIRRPDGDLVVLTCSLEKGDLPLRIAFPVLMKNVVEWFQGDSGKLRQAARTGDVHVVQVDDFLPPNNPADEKETDPEPTVANAETETAESETADIAVVESSSGEQSAVCELVSPDDDVLPIATSGGDATIGPLLRVGVWKVRPRSASNEQPDAAKSVASTEDSPEADSSNTATTDKDELLVACNLTSAEESDLRPPVTLQSVDEVEAMLLGGRSLWFYLALLAIGLLVSEWWLYQRRIVG